MCKKDSNPQPSLQLLVLKLSTLSRECEPWNRSNDVQWCPSQTLCFAMSWWGPRCLCDSFGCYRFLSPSYHPCSSKEFGLRPNCPWVLLRKHFSSLALGNTVRVLSLFQLLQLALCLSSVLFCFKVLWIQSSFFQMYSRAEECSCRLNSNTGMHDFWPRSFESPSRWPSQALCASWCLALGVS